MAGWLPRVRKRGRVGDFPPAVRRLLLTTRSQLVARRFRKRTSVLEMMNGKEITV